MCKVRYGGQIVQYLAMGVSHDARVRFVEKLDVVMLNEKKNGIVEKLWVKFRPMNLGRFVPVL